jgi:mono/diheme cytochrome c family protein
LPRSKKVGAAQILLALMLAVSSLVRAQRNDYPPRPPADPAVVERGQALYGVHCAFCHGPDARGGIEGGPNLLRSQLVLSDQNGELIAEVVLNGRPGTAMPPIKLAAEQISDIAAFVHSFRVGGYDVSRERPLSIVVGEATAGEAVFQSRCASCHSLTGDLKGFSVKFSDPRQLQQAWLMPSAGGRGGGRGGGGGGGATASSVSPATVTVTLPSGQKVAGRLLRIDDFIVTLAHEDGTERTFARKGAIPKVEIHDPLQPHRELLAKYTDKEIHDLTAFLVTVK